MAYDHFWGGWHLASISRGLWNQSEIGRHEKQICWHLHRKCAVNAPCVSTISIWCQQAIMMMDWIQLETPRVCIPTFSNTIMSHSIDPWWMMPTTFMGASMGSPPSTILNRWGCWAADIQLELVISIPWATWCDEALRMGGLNDYTLWLWLT